jgi:hypothetical protein
MKASPQEFAQLRAYVGASRELTNWITGAKVLALLNGAVESGVLNALRTKSTAQQIADVTSIDTKSIADLCLALEVHGVVQRDGECYEMPPNFALISSPNTAIPLANVSSRQWS